MKEEAALPNLLKELRLPTMGNLWKPLAKEAMEKGLLSKVENFLTKSKNLPKVFKEKKKKSLLQAA